MAIKPLEIPNIIFPAGRGGGGGGTHPLTIVRAVMGMVQEATERKEKKADDMMKDSVRLMNPNFPQATREAGFDMLKKAYLSKYPDSREAIEKIQMPSSDNEKFKTFLKQSNAIVRDYQKTGDFISFRQRMDEAIGESGIGDEAILGRMKDTYDAYGNYVQERAEQEKAFISKGGKIVDIPEGEAVPGNAVQDRETGMFWVPPDKTTKKRMVGSTRTIEDEGIKYTEEWDGEKWVQIGETPQWKPDEGKFKGRLLGSTRTIKNRGQVITEEWTKEGWMSIGETAQFKSKSEDNKYKGRLIGSVRKFPRGDMLIAQEWTKDGWKDIAKAPRWKADKKGEISPEKALKEIASMEMSKARLRETKKVDAIFAKMFPEFAEGQTLSEGQLKRAYKACDNYISYMKLFVPENMRKEEPEITGGGAGSSELAERITATNQNTGEQLESFDGGKNWNPVAK